MPVLNKAFTRLPALALALALILGVAAPALADDDPETIERSFGPDRITTSVAASRDHRDSAGAAILATAATYPDALSAGALAAALNAPVLLTSPDELPDIVAAELVRLGVVKVVVLGGTAAISDAVAKDLKALGLTVERIAGSSRYATASAAALEVSESGASEVVLALGEHPDASRAWPDAVAAGALAATADRIPTLLTAPDELPAETEEALADLGAKRVLVVGGEGAISAAVENRLTKLGYEVERFAGASRYETSALLAQEALTRTPAGERMVIFATGSNFPDALSAGALAASVTGPLLLVPPRELSRPVDQFLRHHTDRWAGGVVVGGPAAADEEVLEQLVAALNDAAPAEQVTGSFSGSASWYGPGFEGAKTASGERFDPDDLTAAHRTLAFGTRVRVTNQANGAQVIVRINDRGPFHGGRVIDVSEAAAEILGMKSSGTASVLCEILEG
ncbi:MAG TPA: septal ring lytic transglycosylase RlpA family protein [Egibacteraceae bacterium]|nr:septal ring lytic transglycosylase RlpA family protein [Egibacteraceae bacterium]